MRVRAAVLLALASLTAACAQSRDQVIATYQPPIGSNEVLRGAIDSAPGRQMVVGDLVFPAHSPIPRHYHEGEEFLYVLGGETTISRPGTPDIVLTVGESIRIPPGTVHWGIAGPEGVRAISSWIAVEGQPLRVEVPE